MASFHDLAIAGTSMKVLEFDELLLTELVPITLEDRRMFPARVRPESQRIDIGMLLMLGHDYLHYE